MSLVGFAQRKQIGWSPRSFRALPCGAGTNTYEQTDGGPVELARYGTPNVAMRSIRQKNNTLFSSIFGSRRPYGPG
jgi:hypothetical protein